MARILRAFGMGIFLARLLLSRRARDEFELAVTDFREGMHATAAILARMRAERAGERPPLSSSRTIRLLDGRQMEFVVTEGASC